MFKKYKSSLNFAFGVLIETHCIGQIPGPQLAGNKPCFVAYIIMSVFVPLRGGRPQTPTGFADFSLHHKESLIK
jgi:hypothetical protein